MTSTRGDIRQGAVCLLWGLTDEFGFQRVETGKVK
jgi:hypothetical protein